MGLLKKLGFKSRKVKDHFFLDISEGIYLLTEMAGKEAYQKYTEMVPKYKK
ncbi:MAG: hypothetical protein KC516_04035 [Nanoarchaeota archaeon]|nr:hypothetical protein [Nanoarchaeota archaeon]